MRWLRAALIGAAAAILFGAPASAGSWDGTYECVYNDRSAGTNCGGWTGKAKVRNGRLSGTLHWQGNPVVSGQLSGGRIDESGRMNGARFVTSRPEVYNFSGTLGSAWAGNHENRGWRFNFTDRQSTAAATATATAASGQWCYRPAQNWMLELRGASCAPDAFQVSAADFRSWRSNKTAFLREFRGRSGVRTATAAATAASGQWCYRPAGNAMFELRGGSCAPDAPQVGAAEFRSWRRGKDAFQLAWDRSIAGDDAAAQFRLGLRYEEGAGVAEDRAAARDWYRRAASGGNQRAATALSRIREETRRAEAERQGREDRRRAAERGRLAEEQRIAGLTRGLVRTDLVAAIVNDGVNLRALPERGAEAVKELRRGRQVHVTGALPNGWLLIAEEGEPVGWIFKTAVAAEALAAVAPGGGAPRPANQPAAVAVADPELEPLDAPFRVRSAANVRAAPAVTAARVGGLSTGERVTALGKVRDGNWYLVERDGERMGFVFGPLLQRVGAAQENRDAVAVIVGNKSYRGDVPAVDYAYNDAEAMKRYVIDVLGYRKGNIIDLRDATKGEIEIVFGTERNHRGQLFDFIRAGESDVTVFYSGHGVPGLQDKRGYLLPVDGDPNRAEISGFSLDVLLGNLAKLPARSIQVFLDACFSGNSARGMLIQAASGIGISPALPDAAANFLMLTAASGDQVASWDRDARHGLFTKHLLQALDGAADGEEYGDGDGTVTLNEVKTFLDREMTFQARRRFGREQNATMIGSGDTVLTRL